MLGFVAVFQVSVFAVFFLLERFFPARELPRAKNFFIWWTCLNSFCFVWFAAVVLAWAELPGGVVETNLDGVWEGVCFFFVWSFFGYWWHRLRHSSRFLWRYIHKFHHSPPKMETAVAFFKHPIEYFANTLVMTFVVWCFEFSYKSIVIGLCVEACLEIFHHSNVKLPSRIRLIGYLIQTPEMHLIHHQRGLHKYNYATFLWDTVFGTVKVPSAWHGEQGFATGGDIRGHFLLKF